jgi:hypothetical protein
MMLLERCLQMTAKILVKWVVFADVTLVICMHWPCRVQHACDICWCQFSAPFVDGGDFCLFLLRSLLLQSRRRHYEVADCGMTDSAMRNYVVQLGVLICRTALP